MTVQAGKLRFEIISAPMAGVTDIAFQQILSDLETQVVSTEMIPARSLLCKPDLAARMINRNIHPISVQLFGNDAEIMAQAAAFVQSFGADIIDLNMGCPAKKIVKSGKGVALMRTPEKAVRIIRAVRKAVTCPLSVKLRLGWDAASRNFIDIARSAADSGVDFVTLHARYRSNYSVPAEWKAIRELSRCLPVPVVGNGDVFSVADAERVLNETGCAAVMPGRGLLGNPWLPGLIQRKLSGNGSTHHVETGERLKILLKHLDLMCALHPPKITALAFRKHAAWYLKGYPHSAQLRKHIFTFTHPDQYREFLPQALQ